MVQLLSKSPMENKRFFCLRGFMKSGTNWVGSLLGSHEQISCIGEFHWQEIVVAFNNTLKNQPIFKSDESQEKARRNFEEFIRRCLVERADPAATVIGDRTPHTIIPVTLRSAPHISVIRDGRDILVSRVFHLFNSPEVTAAFDRFPTMAESLKEFQRDPWFFQKNPDRLLCQEVLVRESLTWWREHLRKDELAVESYPNLKIRFVKYEDVHQDTHGERAKLFEFLDVDPLRASDIQGRLKPGFDQERPAQFLRKGVVGDWKNYFTDQTKAWFKEEAGEELIKYGYADSMDW